jgi:hypothetical protein
MSTRILLAAVAILATTLSVGGAEPVRGQVFIVTQGGPAIKLALAKVYFLSPEELAEMQSLAKPKVSALQAKLSEFERQSAEDRQKQLTEVQKSLEKYEAVKSRYNEVVATVGDGPGARAYTGDVAMARNAFESAKLDSEIFTRKLEKQLADTREAVAQRIETLLTEPPEEVAMASLTDADGNFSAEPPGSATHMLILAERQQPREIYRWLLPLHEVRKSKGVFLFSNHNLKKPE